MRATRTFAALMIAGLAVGSCLGGDGPTDVGGEAIVRLALQPALIPSPADAGALPINRIRTVAVRDADAVVLRERRFDVSPLSAAWTLDIEVPASGEPVQVVIYLYLINVATDGTEAVQFSGRTPPMSVTVGDRLTNVDADIVRGPLSNLAVTGVAIGSYPDTLFVGSSGTVSATATTSETTPPSIFWTSRDPAVVSMVDSVATGVAPGTATVLASAGAFADSVSIVVVVPPVDSVMVSPDSADVVLGSTRAYSAVLRDAGGAVLSGRVVRWSTANSVVATVDSITGVVTGVTLGTTTVRATSEGVFDDAVVRVVAVPVRSVLVSPDSAVVEAGSTTGFTAQTRDSVGGVLTGRTVTWTTGDAAIATVNATSGVVTGVAVGTTTVRATSEGVFDEAGVRVTAPPTGGGATNSWIPPGGVWSDPAKWSLGRIPQAGDTVLFTSGVDYSITMDVDASVARVVIGGTSDVISLNIGDQRLELTSTTDPGLEILPLGSIQMNNGTLVTPDIENAGSVRTTGVATISTPRIVNDANWRVASGVQVVGSASGGDFHTTGTVTVEGAGSVSFTQGTNVSYEGGSIEGGGIITMNNGLLTLFQDWTLDSLYLAMQDGAIVTSGPARRLTIGQASAVQFLSVSQLSEVNARVHLLGSLFVSGPSTFFNDSLIVDVDAVLLVDSGAGETRVGTVDVDNAGLIALSGSSATYFGPGGTTARRILNRVGGTLQTLTGAGRFINGELVNEGDLYLAGPTELHRRTVQGGHVAAQHLNSGVIEIPLGGGLTTVLGGTGPSFTNQGTIAVDAGATFSVTDLSDGSFTNAAAGEIRGAGTIDVTLGAPTVTNLGTIAPGTFSTGRLTWQGSLPFGASATVAIDIEGVAPGTDHDVLDVDGTLFLDGNGTLDVAMPFFTPAGGDRFPILTGVRSGDFAAINLPTIAGVTLTPVWATDGLVDTLFIETTGGPAGSNVWIWMSGDSLTDQAGSYGALGVPAATNQPPSRQYATSWTDAVGNLWMFGGVTVSNGLLNDLWRFDGTDWTWMGGSNTVGQSGVYGTQGQAALGNVPGARWEAVSWTDADGSMWLFGGLGVDGSGAVGYLNDLWVYNGLWTWVSGSQSVNQAATYGVQGQPDPGNVPSARRSSVPWIDANGDLCLFGGLEAHSPFRHLNDLWCFDGVDWTWESGANTANQLGTYGTLGVPGVANVPGARYGAVAWTDSFGALWVFGGNGYGATGTPNLLNDLWRYDGSQWTWVSGSNAIDASGSYGTLGVPSGTNVPGSRHGAISWIDGAGDLWLFGGQGFIVAQGFGYHNDVWRFDGLFWTWMSGSQARNQPGVYGVRGAGDAGTVPGARQQHASWRGAAGDIWVFGGHGYGTSPVSSALLNDLWRYQP